MCRLDEFGSCRIVEEQFCNGSDDEKKCCAWYGWLFQKVEDGEYERGIFVNWWDAADED